MNGPTSTPPSVPESTPRFRGAVERISEQVVAGWAIETATPQQATELRFICEGVELGLMTPNIERPALSAQLGHPVLAGFRWLWKDQTAERLLKLIQRLRSLPADEPLSCTVQTADGQALPLVGAAATSPCARSALLAALRQGAIDAVNGNALRGWYHDSSQPGAALVLTAYCDGVLLGPVQMEAATSAADINAAARRNFQLRWNDLAPQTLGAAVQRLSALPLDEAPELQVHTDDGASIILGGNTAEGRFTRLQLLRALHPAAIDSVSLAGVTGWHHNRALPRMADEIALYCDEQLVTQVLSTIQRESAADGQGRGFQLRWDSLPLTQLMALDRALAIPDPETSVRWSLRLDAAVTLAEAPFSKEVPTRRALRVVVADAIAARTQTRERRRETMLATVGPGPRPQPEYRADVFAFYLPQFHPIAENDNWWGPGFTEWTNVSAAQPQYSGHDQPRLPSELGFYDIRTPGVMEAQVALASQYGLAGFCFHYYWFSGQRILEEPLRRFLALDHRLGFCLCWANEPWSRRWDGGERDVLLAQEHRHAVDSEFIESVLPYLHDPRYRRIDGCPMIVIYRVGLLEEPQRSFAHWRKRAIEEGFPGLHLCITDGFGAGPPEDYGCDAVLEFPPLDRPTQPLAVDELVSGFGGHVLDYAAVVRTAITAEPSRQPCYPGVMLGWDNTARRGSHSTVFGGYSPELFSAWMEHACARAERTLPEGRRLVFVNAWNEWAEGSYLEPDRRWGRRALEALRDAVVGTIPADTHWRLLREQLPAGSQAAVYLERLEARMQAQQRLLDDERAPVPVCSRWTRHAPPGCEHPIDGGTATVDRYGSGTGDRYQCMSRADWLTLDGVAAVPELDVRERTPLFLTCRAWPGEDLPQIWYAALTRRVRQQPPDQPADWSRFQFRMPLADLPEGRYCCALIWPGYLFEDGRPRSTPLDAVLDIVA